MVRVPAEVAKRIDSKFQPAPVGISVFQPTPPTNIPFRSWKAAKNLEREREKGERGKGEGHLLDLPDDPDLKAS